MAKARSDDTATAVEVLLEGGLVAFPTETVYGLGADAGNAVAVRRVFEVKRRPPGHPLIVHLPDRSALDEWASSVPPAADALARAFWPGPLTLLLRRSGRVPDEVTGGADVVGLRVPSHPLALELLHAFGGGIAAPSANRFGKVSPTTADHVRADLGDDVDVILDGGPCRVGIESTIVDCTTDEPEVVRPGGVTYEELDRVLAAPVGVWLGERTVAAPGTLAAHYAPNAAVVVVDEPSDARVLVRTALRGDQRVAILAPEQIDDLPPSVTSLAPAGDPASYAAVLYDRLREADRMGIDLVIAVPPPDRDIGRAVRDRLRRAASDLR
jgi:L-threonylcarbamoyladenylate synthase